MFQHSPGVLQVTCGHCSTQFLTDANGHAEHHCLGCCAEHQSLPDELTPQQEDKNIG